jgi:hypothetical protein
MSEIFLYDRVAEKMKICALAPICCDFFANAVAHQS